MSRSQKFLVNLIETNFRRCLKLSLQLHPDRLTDEDVVFISLEVLAVELQTAPVAEKIQGCVLDVMPIG